VGGGVAQWARSTACAVRSSIGYRSPSSIIRITAPTAVDLRTWRRRRILSGRGGSRLLPRRTLTRQPASASHLLWLTAQVRLDHAPRSGSPASSPDQARLVAVYPGVGPPLVDGHGSARLPRLRQDPAECSHVCFPRRARPAPARLRSADRSSARRANGKAVCWRATQAARRTLLCHSVALIRDRRCPRRGSPKSRDRQTLPDKARIVSAIAS